MKYAYKIKGTLVTSEGRKITFQQELSRRAVANWLNRLGRQCRLYFHGQKITGYGINFEKKRGYRMFNFEIELEAI